MKLHSRTLLLTSALLFLTSCGITPYGNLARDVVRTRGAQVEDAGVKNAMWYLCYAASVGSIQRAFGRSVARAELYRQMCKGELDANVIGNLDNSGDSSASD